MMQLTGLLAANTPVSAAAEGPAQIQNIGYIVLGVILVPVFLLTVAALIEHPKTSKIPELFLSAFVIMISAMVGGFFVIGFLLKFIVPQ